MEHPGKSRGCRTAGRAQTGAPAISADQGRAHKQRRRASARRPLMRQRSSPAGRDAAAARAQGLAEGL